MRVPQRFVVLAKPSLTITEIPEGWGAAMFATLYDLVGPEEFNGIIGGYCQRLVAGGTTRDFIDFATRVSRKDLSGFFDDWLQTTRWTTVIAKARTPADLVAHYRLLLTSDTSPSDIHIERR